MNKLRFQWKEQEPLADELRRPIKQVFLELAQHGRPIFVTLWRADGTGVRIHSEMHDVAERTEIGILNFSRIITAPSQKQIVNPPSAFRHEINLSKLIIQESGTNAESGIILEAGSHEIVVVAGAYPYSLAVGGLSPAPYIFEPEYPIASYTRVPITHATQAAQ